MPTTVAYSKCCFNKVRRYLRSDNVYEFKLCKGTNGSKGTYCIIHIRNIVASLVLLIIIVMYCGSRYHDKEFDKAVPKRSLSFLKFRDINYQTLNISYIKRLINEHNTNETILNKCSFDEVKWNTIILVVQIEKLTYPLRHFIVSLSQVRGIGEALLIFSHSRYDINLNRFIRSIDFVRVQQIFYPYSLQVNPKTFPGYNPNDCHPSEDIQTALTRNCTGALTPDVRGSFRDPEKAGKKHHWWWTANKVFEDLKFSGSHEGLVFFLDEDLFLLEDALYLAIYMKGVVGALPHCEFFSLTTPLSDQFKYDINDVAKLEISEWTPENFSSALGFDMDTWNKIVVHYDIFCNVDDYSWSKSLFEISKSINHGKERFKVISSVIPRAYKIGYHSFFESIKRRVIFENAYTVREIQQNLGEKLFPATFKIYISNDTVKDDLKEEILSGGWSDPRDKRMCIKMTIRKIKKVFFKMALEYE